MKSKQRGYYGNDLAVLINLLIVFAVIGAIALLVGVPYAVWWLIENVSIGWK